MNEKNLTFNEYLDYVSKKWEEGNVDELEEKGLIIIINEQSTKNDVHYRSLTEEEYNEKYK